MYNIQKYLKRTVVQLVLVLVVTELNKTFFLKATSLLVYL